MDELSNNRERFFKLLDAYPAVAACWDRDDSSLNIDRADRFIRVCSSGERAMLQFFAGLWIGENEYEFDLFKSVKYLDDRELKVIQDWIADPFYP